MLTPEVESPVCTICMIQQLLHASSHELMMATDLFLETVFNVCEEALMEKGVGVIRHV